jgi:hypothetical protein
MALKKAATEVLEENLDPVTPEEPTTEPKPKVKAGQMVTCALLRGAWLRQPSTKIAIYRGDHKELKADGWLKMQVDAGLIEIVEV